MSTDFTGNNSHIDEESLIRMSADVLGRILGINRDSIFNFYVAKGKCNADGDWRFYDRYSSFNEYSGNKLDDLIMLRECVKETEFEDKNLSSVVDRRAALKESLADEISTRRCNLISTMLEQKDSDGIHYSMMIPHLDIPDTISIDASRQDSICELSGIYNILTPEIDYTDSCRMRRSYASSPLSGRLSRADEQHSW